MGLPRRASASCRRTSAASASTSTRGSRSARCTSAARSPRVLDELRARGATYEHDGATWLRTSDFGDQRDRVLVKSDGATTYLCNDLAYHRGQVRPRLEPPRRHLGRRPPRPGEVAPGRARGARSPGRASPRCVLGQLVKLVSRGELVRMSKRTGNIVTLADILDEVDPDVCRLTFLLQSIDTAQTFDLDVVTAQSMENPVYYVQYAHARIASIGRQAAERGIDARPAPRREPRAARARTRARPAPRARRVPRGGRRGRGACGRRTGSRRGCATSRRASTASTATAASSPTTPRSRRRGSGSRRPAGSASRARSRSSACTRPTR